MIALADAAVILEAVYTRARVDGDPRPWLRAATALRTVEAAVGALSSEADAILRLPGADPSAVEAIRRRILAAISEAIR